MKVKTFETERLFLRPTAVEDADFVLQILNTPKWLKYIGDRKVGTKEEAEKYIQERMTPQLERLGFSNYTVIRKSDQVKIGSCGLYDREGLEGVDIGFAFLPDYEGQGYATEAAMKIKEAGQEVFGIKKMSGITVEYNHSSRKLLEKLGFKFVKMIRLPNDDEELMLYEFHA